MRIAVCGGVIAGVQGMIQHVKVVVAFLLDSSAGGKLYQKKFQKPGLIHKQKGAGRNGRGEYFIDFVPYPFLRNFCAYVKGAFDCG